MGRESAAYELSDLRRELREFVDERDWARFHDPKSLILALVGEVGELAELFQWVPADEAAVAFADGRPAQRAAEEMSDILIYLVNLADVLGIDLLASARAKLAASATKYPAGQTRSTAPVKGMDH